MDASGRSGNPLELVSEGDEESAAPRGPLVEGWAEPRPARRSALDEQSIPLSATLTETRRVGPWVG